MSEPDDAARPRPRAALVVTGDEVLLGRVVERNAAFVAAELDARGVEVIGTRIVADRLERIAAAVGEAAARADLVVVTGGLGPTHDDRTMEAVAGAAGCPFAIDATALAWIEERVADASPRYRLSRGRVGARVEKQATLPVGARPLRPVGTAPGAVLTIEGALVVVLPGPPGELQPMWRDALGDPAVAALLAHAPGRARVVVRLAGVSESELVTALDALDPALVAAVDHGIYTRAGELEVNLDAPPGDRAAADRLADALADRFGDALFTRTGELVEEVVGARLIARGELLAVAESCTGGGLGTRITALPGASAWFAGGVIAYADHVKRDLLHVSAATLAEHGAVSEATARAMAEGARRVAGAHWALAITGIAGPGGGSPDKPVGLVVVGLAGPHGSEAREHRLGGGRAAIRDRAATIALHALRRGLA